MKISVAQTRPVKGDIPANVAAHEKWIGLAVLHNADALFFPELSLTGYEPELAQELAIQQDDDRFNNFQASSDRHKITLGIGVPIRTDAGIQIGLLLFQPHVPKQVYAKQHLHVDEFAYFVPGGKQILATVGTEIIVPAICYESLQTGHADKAHQLGADIYVASVAKSQNGVGRAYVHYAETAKKHSMPVLMANCVGHCADFLSAGSSAVWTKDGRLAGRLDGRQEGLLVFDSETEEATTPTA